ncbi:hypothetical protein K2173_013918 [Erythroxylum novogranatense]|uniref:Zinc knuckle CX2CX4HX4C domain-containing protein n=1 Tax=Erythroxylum novogranatense TaxID=1862640 RepID=A0AAV8SD86_9ROSI|nr:hypothetical protein K2173_013918 [Erythroxylum novogranatense]
MANRGKFARIAVEIDLHRPLMPSIELDGETYLISYEGLPQVCVRCGVLGHPPTAYAVTASAAPPTPFQSTAWAFLRLDKEDVRLQQAARRILNPLTATGRGHTCNEDVLQWCEDRANSGRLRRGQNIVAEKTAQQETNQPSRLPFGMGQRLNLFSFKGTERTSQQSWPSKAADRSRGPARGAKGKGLTTSAQPRVVQGQASVGPAPASAPELPIRLKPTPSDRDLVVTIPTHYEMLCDNKLIAEPNPLVAEGPLGIDEVANPERPRTFRLSPR